MPEYCQIERWDGGACESVIAWLAGSAGRPASVNGAVWLLVFCDDGASLGAVEELAGSLTPHKLLELRLFGPESELLIWRGDKGLRGRMLRDAGSAAAAGPLRPSDEARLLLEKTGSGERLRVRHYYEQDECTGAVRIAASRLVGISAEGA